MRALFRTYGVLFAWVVALTATGGSLFLSEVMGYLPCRLCWFQRIFMYPLALLLGRAAIRDDRGIVGYALPLTVIGGLISAYHYALQKVPGMAEMMPCQAGIPCDQDYLNGFGFITIPFLAFIAFALISLFLLVSRKPAEAGVKRENEAGGEVNEVENIQLTGMF